MTPPPSQAQSSQNASGRGGRQVIPTVESGLRPLLSFAEARRGEPPEHLANLDVAERKDRVAKAGFPIFRANQLSRHYSEHSDVNPERMTDLPARGCEELASTPLPPSLTKVRNLIADRGLTIKSLWQMFDGAMVETVLMKYSDRATLCISSQAGCGMACPSRATGQRGPTRNLSAGETVGQVRCGMLATVRDDLGEPCRLTNVVFMGMGEPLANQKQMLKALRRIIEPSPAGFGLSARNVTILAMGMAPLIEKLTEQGMSVTLAIFLHVPDDELRDPLIPINSQFDVGRPLDAARPHFAKTGRRVSVGYALIRDMNDYKWCAQPLADGLNRRGRDWAHVNPIPLNPTPGSTWTASTPEAQNTFIQTLLDADIPTAIRDTHGSDTDGACGQLAAEVTRFSVKAAKAAEAAELARRGSGADGPGGVLRRRIDRFARLVSSTRDTTSRKSMISSAGRGMPTTGR